MYFLLLRGSVTAKALLSLVFALVFLGRFVVNVPEISLAGWMVYFAMYGSSNIVLYRKSGTQRSLVWGIIAIAVSIAFGAAIVIKNVM